MTLISKTAGGLSLISCIHDIHKTAMINSNNKYAKVSSEATIATSIGNQKINKVSYKDAQRKNWLAQSQFGLQAREISARVTGYISGAVKAGARYIPNFALATVAILSGKKIKDADKATAGLKKCWQNIISSQKLANGAAIGLGIIEAWDFIKNSTNIAQRTDYLE